MNSKLKKLFRGKNERTGGKSKLKSLWKKAKEKLEKAVLVSALAAGVSMGVSACGDTITNNYYYYNQRDGGSDVIQLVDAETKQATSLCDVNPVTISLSMPLQDENTLDKGKYYFWKPEDLPHIIQVTTATSNGVILKISKKQPSEDGWHSFTFENKKIVSSGDFNKNLKVSLDDGDAELAVCDVSFGSSFVRITMAGEGEFCAGPLKLSEFISDKPISIGIGTVYLNVMYEYVVPESCEDDFTPLYLLNAYRTFPEGTLPGIPLALREGQTTEVTSMPEDIILPEIPFLEENTYLIGAGLVNFYVGIGKQRPLGEGGTMTVDNYKFKLEAIELHNDGKRAVVSVYDLNTNNLLQRVTVPESELYELSLNNHSYKIYISHISYGDLYNSWWAYVAVLKRTYNIPENYDPTNNISATGTFTYEYENGESYTYNIGQNLVSLLEGELPDSDYIINVYSLMLKTDE